MTSSSSSGRWQSRYLEFCEVGQRSTGLSKADLNHAGLLMLLAANDRFCVETMVHALAVGRPLMLIDPKLTTDKLCALTSQYRPSDIIAPVSRSDIWAELSERFGGTLKSESHWWRSSIEQTEIHEDLALLLPTSGTTGSPRFVRLSKNNIGSNAVQIASSLEISSSDVGVTSLPVHYSFGFSILNSHMAAASKVLVTDRSILEEKFWDLCKEAKVTILAGVPSTFEMILRLDLHKRFPDSIRLLIQAGGSLREDAQVELIEIMRSRGGDFLPMYGQTEASPRMACMPLGALPAKLGSVGKALSGAKFSLINQDSSALGEIVYQGPNVMMGYAESLTDLKLGDELNQTLRTGDIGEIDPDGFLYLRGRIKRIAKVNGIRISLDDVERIASKWGSNMCVSPKPDVVQVWFETANSAIPTNRILAPLIGIPFRNIDVRSIERLPVMDSGKRDYRALEEQF